MVVSTISLIKRPKFGMKINQLSNDPWLGVIIFKYKEFVISIDSSIINYVVYWFNGQMFIAIQ